MAAYNDKYHIGLNSEGYILANKRGRKWYQKKRAPTFVNKFGGGDSFYRDATFWQYFVQTNWRNGAKQLKWDDPGKFWKSDNVDTTQLEKLTLSRKLVSAGQLASGIKVNAMESLRASASSPFGDGGDSTLSISTDTTDAPIDSACTGTAGATTLSATNASFAAGQKILIHQTRGTGCGNYETNTISAYTAGTITTTDSLENTYTTGAQVLVMKEYTTVTIDSTKTLTAKAWNGTVGGIIAFYANTSTTVTGTISATGKGFVGATANTLGTGYAGEGSSGASVYKDTIGTNNGSGGGGGNERTDGAPGGGGGGNGAAGTAASDIGGQAGGHGGDATGAADLATMTFGGGGGRGGGAGTGSPGKDYGGVGGPGGGIVFIFSKTITVTGAITTNGSNGSNATGTKGGGGGGGAGGSVLLKTQTGVLGSGLITATGGSGGSYNTTGTNGGAGAVGRIHISYSSTYSGTTSPTIDSAIDTALADTPAATEATLYAGGSDGKVYQYTAPDTWAEVFDARRLTWYDDTTLKDADYNVGDVGGTETAQSQGFQTAVAQTVKAVQVYLKKNTGTPGNITVRVETNNAGVPSGTLVHANATGTITSFTSTDYGWVTCTFADAFAVSATTQYHLVLKTAAADNDNYYSWGGDDSSPSYSSGARSSSADGGSSWSAQATDDLLFRILSNPCEVYTMKTSSLSTSNVMYIGVGDVNSITNGDARIYAYTGTTFTLNKTFTTSIDSCVLSIEESPENTKAYIGVGPQARIYETADFSTYTLSKKITVPQNPGYPYSIREYNSYVYAAGGHPEQIPTGYYQGFVHYYDTTKWRKLYDFDFTVMKSQEFFDSYLFMGTYHGQLFLYDTSSLNPLFSYKDDYSYKVQVYNMKYFDDKLYIGLYPQAGSGETNVGIWMFDRRGLHNAHHVSTVAGYTSFCVTNGILYVGTGNDGYVYKLSTDQYEATGYYQSSYFDANLPSIPKLFNKLTIRHDALNSGESIAFYYRTKEDDDWTLLGTSDTAGDIEKDFSFAAGTTANKISLKGVLSTTTETTTPVLTEVIMQYSLYPARKWQWTMRIYAKDNLTLLDKTEETRTADEIREDLEGLMNTETLYTYVDVDGTSYSVLMTDIDQSSWVLNQDDINEDEIVITLLEA